MMETPPGPPPQPTNRPLRILLIDDDPDDRAVVARDLEHEFPSLEVIQVGDAQGFERALDSGSFDLVITDDQLRWTDGLKVLRIVRGRLPAIPIIMFTAGGSEEIAVEAMKSGLDDYVLKSPGHFVRLRAAIRLTLERSRTRRALHEAETRYQNLFERVPVGLFRASRKGRLLDANPALAEILGFPNRHALLASGEMLPYVEPADHRALQQILEIRGTVRAFDARVRRRDGSIAWISITARAVGNADGRFVEYEGSA
ncbi:MAG TPA: response regulator, partial [Candidatus Polarisedimenticolia bacterium]|nr:response regulator [Candidatus Polarisedimenticolia bacterium]